MTTTSAGCVVESEDLARGGVRLAVHGARADVVLERAERRNAMTPSMWLALGKVPALLPDVVRVVVVRGEGQTFCAGLDLRLVTPEGVPGEGSMADLIEGMDAQRIADQIAIWQQGMLWLRDPRWITIAAVQGAAVGAGFQLALSADLRIADKDARFCMRENALGLIPDLTGTKAISDLVGYARALEICASSRWVEAAEAARLGLVQSVVPLADLPAAVDAQVDALLATDAAAGVALKELLLAAPGRDLAAQARAERTAQALLLRAVTDRIAAGG